MRFGRLGLCASGAGLGINWRFTTGLMHGLETSCRVIWKCFAKNATRRNTAKIIAAYTVRDKAGKPHPCEETGHLINDLYRR
jgi:hypothetical protein